MIFIKNRAYNSTIKKGVYKYHDFEAKEGKSLAFTDEEFNGYIYALVIPTFSSASVSISATGTADKK